MSRPHDEIVVGSVWRHKASGDEYMRGAWVDADGHVTGGYWKHLPFGMIAGWPRDTKPVLFRSEFDLVGFVNEDGDIEYTDTP